MEKSGIWKKVLLYGLIILAFMSTSLFFIGQKNLQVHPYEDIYAKEEPESIIEVGPSQGIIRQSFVNHGDWISGLVMRFATYGYSFLNGEIRVTLKTEAGELLGEAILPASDLLDNADAVFVFAERVPVQRDEKYLIEVDSNIEDDGRIAAAWAGKPQADCVLTGVGGVVEKTLYMDLTSFRDADFYRRFILSIGVLLFIFLFTIISGMLCDQKGKLTPVTEMIHIFDQYTFLLKKLVGRDFAVKYRRSYLGFMWVILNPLLTMIVMSSVFSYIFRLQIKNYAVYLILGNIVFGCFSEATQLATQSIVGSGQMIKKVYIPKYIFPLSKVIFSFFNFLLTLIPAVIVILYYRIPFTYNYLLLPYVFLGLFLFALGVGMFLAALQVFMRDTQYLYGILLTLWTYLTPIFYSEESLSPQLRTLMQFNPMFLYVNCTRKIMLYGITPTVFQLLFCILIGVFALTVGMRYFYRKQKLFILHI